MIIKLEKAILHILDKDNGPIYSQQELDITERLTAEYIEEHIKKVFNKSKLRNAVFENNSEALHLIRNYENNKTDFISISKHISSHIYEYIQETEKATSADVIICKFIVESIEYIGILKFDLKPGYMHSIMLQKDDDSSVSERHAIITPAKSVLPAKSQAISECAFVNMTDKSILYKSKVWSIDGNRIDAFEESVLECICETKSDNEINKFITDYIKKVSKTPLEDMTEYKEYMQDKIANKEESYTMQELADEVFNSDKSTFLDMSKSRGIVQTETQELSIEDYTKKKIRDKITIVTELGIEIKFPLSVYQSGALQVNRTSEDTFSITINENKNMTIK